jgi:hypothetical protein
MGLTQAGKKSEESGREPEQAKEVAVKLSRS